MADQWQQFADNIYGANGGNGANIYKNYAVGKVGIDESPQAFTGPTANVQAKIDDANAANAKAAADLQAQKAQDAIDPSKAKMVLLPDNKGYAFYDGTGQQININQFSLLTGKRPDEILGNSPVPKDQKFVKDYQTLTKMSNAWVNGDTKTLAELRSQDPNKFNQLISTYKSPSDMVAAFTKHWSDYYSPGPGQAAQPPAQNQGTGTFAPQPINTNAAAAKAAGLDSGNLGQVLTPQPQTAPKESFWDKLNPWSANHQATNRYKNLIKSNPWFAYHNSLYGG